jgi:hypothetical protein
MPGGAILQKTGSEKQNWTCPSQYSSKKLSDIPPPPMKEMQCTINLTPDKFTALLPPTRKPFSEN